MMPAMIEGTPNLVCRSAVTKPAQPPAKAGKERGKRLPAQQGGGSGEGLAVKKELPPELAAVFEKLKQSMMGQ